MRFAMPHFPGEFEIPDEWFVGVALTPRQSGEVYRTPSPSAAVPLKLIQPPHRARVVPHDWRGFNRDRFLHVLRRMSSDQDIDALHMVDVPQREFPPQPYPLLVSNGFHRFYAAVALGFDHVPRLIEV